VRKFKFISTIASMFLLIALLAFGVYAASSVSFSVSSTVSFEVTDVYVEVYYGKEGGTIQGPFYSSPNVTNEATKWQSANTLENTEFTEEVATCIYYVTVKNLHGMAIHLRFDYEWTGISKYAADNADGTISSVSVVSKIAEADEQGNYNFESINALTNTTTSTDVSGVRTSTVKGDSTDLTVSADSTTKFQVTLTLKPEAMNYVLQNGSGLKIRMKAALDDITTMDTAQG